MIFLRYLPNFHAFCFVVGGKNKLAVVVVRVTGDRFLFFIVSPALHVFLCVCVFVHVVVCPFNPTHKPHSQPV